MNLEMIAPTLEAVGIDGPFGNFGHLLPTSVVKTTSNAFFRLDKLNYTMAILKCTLLEDVNLDSPSKKSGPLSTCQTFQSFPKLLLLLLITQVANDYLPVACPGLPFFCGQDDKFGVVLSLKLFKFLF